MGLGAGAGVGGPLAPGVGAAGAEVGAGAVADGVPVPAARRRRAAVPRWPEPGPPGRSGHRGAGRRRPGERAQPEQCPNSRPATRPVYVVWRQSMGQVCTGSLLDCSSAYRVEHVRAAPPCRSMPPAAPPPGPSRSARWRRCARCGSGRSMTPSSRSRLRRVDAEAGPAPASASSAAGARGPGRWPRTSPSRGQYSTARRCPSRQAARGSSRSAWLNGSWRPDRPVRLGEAADQPEVEGGVGQHVDHGRAGRQHPVLHPQVRAAVHDVVDRPVPAVDGAVVQPQLGQARYAAGGSTSTGSSSSQIGSSGGK